MDGVKESVHRYKGRTLIAARNFGTRELVFEEVPIVSCQFPYNQDLGYAACDHCMTPLETAQQNLRRLAQMPDIELPSTEPDNFVKPSEHVECSTCRAKYCGTECLQTAKNYYHESLCAEQGTAKADAIKKLREKWQSIHYPPEESTIMLVLRIYAIIHQAEDKSAISSSFQNFTLVGSEEAETRWVNQQDAKHMLWELLVDCVKILKLDVPDVLLTLEAFGKILSMIALNSQGIASSSFGHWIALHDENKQVTDRNFEKFVEAAYKQLEETVGLQFLDNEGSGLYSVQSKMSHSCEPNTEIIFPKASHVLGVRTLRDIHQGEELTFSYIDDCQLIRSRHSRQKLIKEKYLFDCLCHKCELESYLPDETSESEMDDDDDDDDDDVENDMNFVN